MSVAPTDLTNLLQNPNVQSLMSNLGGGSMSSTDAGLGGGVLGAVLIGALLPRLLGDQNGTAATVAAANATHQLTASDVTTQVGALLNMQDINEVKRDVFQSESNIKSSILQSEINSGLQNGITTKAVTDNAAWLQTTQLQGQIAQLQSNAAAIAATNAGTNEVVRGIDTAVAASVAATNVSGAATLANLNLLNTNLLQGVNSIEKTIVADGSATRALIIDMNTANLNRQIIVADNRIAELLGDRNTVAGGINVNTTVNQAQAQAQAQQQAINTNNLLAQLVTSIQHNTQSTVNLGTMIGSGQTATNVRS